MVRLSQGVDPLYRSMDKKVILTDMDSIIADFYFGVLDAYKADTGVDLPPEYIGGWDCDFPNGKNIFHYFSQPGFFRNLKVIPGSQEVLKALHDQGNEIVIASAATLTNAPGEKYEWLDEHFPWIKRDRVFFGKEKFRLRGDVLIDDHHLNVKAWKEQNRFGVTLGITYPYNAAHEAEFDTLAVGYQEMDKAWKTIAKELAFWTTT